jgi:hypothetical protein
VWLTFYGKSGRPFQRDLRVQEQTIAWDSKKECAFKKNKGNFSAPLSNNQRKKRFLFKELGQ